MTDITGDIHCYVNTLEALLQKMVDEKHKGAYTHPNRKVLFVGDYIDRRFHSLNGVLQIRKWVLYVYLPV